MLLIFYKYSVATCLMCGGIFNNYVANSLISLTKKFNRLIFGKVTWKSILVPFFIRTRCIIEVYRQIITGDDVSSDSVSSPFVTVVHGNAESIRGPRL